VTIVDSIKSQGSGRLKDRSRELLRVISRLIYFQRKLARSSLNISDDTALLLDSDKLMTDK
jgi:hypothetical protein